MAEKMIIAVKAAGVGETFRFTVPVDMKVGQAKKMMISLICEECPGMQCKTTDIHLTEPVSGQVYDDEKSIDIAGFETGKTVILI